MPPTPECLEPAQPSYVDSLEPLVLEGVALPASRATPPRLIAADLDFVAQPQIVFRPDVVLLYGPMPARVVDVALQRWDPKLRAGGDKRIWIPDAEDQVARPPGAVAAVSLQRMTHRSLVPGDRLLVTASGGAECAVALGAAHDGSSCLQRVAMGFSTDLPLAPAGGTVVTARAPCRGRIRVVTIATEAAAGELSVCNLSIGKNSQLPSSEGLPFELFAPRAGGHGLSFDSDLAEPDHRVTLSVYNLATVARRFKCTLHFERARR